MSTQPPDAPGDDRGAGDHSADAPQRTQLFDFLRSRDARIACPFCGREEWNGWDELVAVDHVAGAELDQRATEAFPLTCVNCGFIRLQSAHVLDDPRATRGHVEPTE